jgi:hypothetical protein
MKMRATATAAALALHALLPETSASAAPANDARTAPAAIGALPAQLRGTTVDATRADTDPTSACTNSGSGPNVWYRFTAPRDGRVAVRLTADDDLDGALDAYLSERSQARALECDFTDDKGLGAVDFDVKAGSEYLISVTQLANSVAGTFTLTLVAPQPDERPPGARLAPGGADGTLDRVGNTEDAYSLRMRAGRTYRFRLSGRGPKDEESPGCAITAAVYGPRPTAFSGAAVQRFGCDAGGYATFTPGPGEGGRYSILLSAARTTRELQHYHLEAAGAGSDDIAPGRFLANRSTVKGDLNGARIDALDLYRFSVAKRSDLTLKLTTGGRSFDLLLLDEKGRRVQCACGASGTLELRRRLAPGRYFVAIGVRDNGQGAYELSRASRVLTKASAGLSRRRVRLGGSVDVRVRIRPAVSGPVSVVLQRFDPLSGWLFYRLERTRAVKGRAGIAFRPPAVGRWRARASFDGTIGAGSSQTGFAELLVVSGGGGGSG